MLPTPPATHTSPPCWLLSPAQTLTSPPGPLALLPDAICSEPPLPLAVLPTARRTLPPPSQADDPLESTTLPLTPPADAPDEIDTPPLVDVPSADAMSILPLDDFAPGPLMIEMGEAAPPALVPERTSTAEPESRERLAPVSDAAAALRVRPDATDDSEAPAES